MNEPAEEKEPSYIQGIFEQRLASRDINAIFMHGGCFHFALTLHRRYGYKLAYIPLNGGMGHVWARKDNLFSIDVNGVMNEDVLIRLFTREKTAVPALQISVEALEAKLSKMNYTDEHNAKVFALAESILDTNERFKNAVPRNEVFQKMFEKEMEEERKKLPEIDDL